MVRRRVAASGYEGGSTNPTPLVPYRRIVRLTLVGYATLTILLWIAIGERGLLGFSTTADEVVLVILLLLEGRRMRSRRDEGL